MVSSEEPQTRQKSEPGFKRSAPRQHRVLVVQRRVFAKPVDDRNERREKREEHEAGNHCSVTLNFSAHFGQCALPHSFGSVSSPHAGHVSQSS